MPPRREPGNVHIHDYWKKKDGSPSAKAGSGKRWYVRWNDLENKQKYKAFSLRKDAEKFKTQVISDLLRGDYIDRKDSQTTVGAMYNQWLPTQVQLKPKTTYNIESKWRVHLEPKWGNRELGSIRRPDISAWVAECVDEGVGPATIDQAVGILKRILDYAVDAGKLNANPAIGVKVPRVTKRAHVYLSIDQVDLLVSKMGHYETLVRVLAFCGLRWGEAVALRVKDVDLMRRRFNVHTTDSTVGGRRQDSTPKTNKIRSVPFPAILISDLEKLIGNLKPTDRIFTTENGSPVNGDNFRNRVYNPAIDQLQDEGDFPRLTIHDLRHTCASLAVSSGANVKAVQRMLGHASAAMTLDTYSDLFDSDLDVVSAKMDELILLERLRCVVGVWWKLVKATPLFWKVALTLPFT